MSALAGGESGNDDSVIQFRSNAVAGAAVGVLTTLLVAGCNDGDRPALGFEPAQLPVAHVGQPYDVVIRVTHNRTPVDSAALGGGALPAGLVLEKAPNGVGAHIVGRPTAAGTSSFTLRVTCFGTNVTGQSGSRSYTLDVRP